MDDRRVGRIVREVRIRKHWRQRDLASAAATSPGVISLIEHGRLEQVALPSLRRVGAALDIRIGIDAWWRGGEVDRLLDRAHAALVEHVAGVLRAHGWTVRVEVSFNVFGERGSVDVVGWQPAWGALAIGECKSRIGDVQELHATFGRKVRLVPEVLRRDEGWVAAHPTTFGTVWPERTRAARRWVRRPVDPPDGAGFGAILFVPAGRLGRAGARVVDRVRLP